MLAFRLVELDRDYSRGGNLSSCILASLISELYNAPHDDTVFQRLSLHSAVYSVTERKRRGVRSRPGDQ